MIEEVEMKRVPWQPIRHYQEEHEDMFWFQDSIHLPIPLSPMTTSNPLFPYGSQWACRELSFPFSKGLTYVTHYGYIYVGAIPVIDEDEIKARGQIWGEKFGYVLGNWDNIYAATLAEWNKNLEFLYRNSVEIDKMPWGEMLAVLNEAQRLTNSCEGLFMYHFYVAQFCYMMLEGICNKHGIPEKEMTKLLKGGKTEGRTKIYECDAELWRLTLRAKELGLTDVFLREENMEELPAKLSQVRAGEQWFNEFNEFLKVYGHKQVSGISDYSQRSWFEYPAAPLFTIKTFLMQEEVDVDEVLAQARRGREELTQEALAKMETEEERKEFLQALGAAQKTYPLNEDHAYYRDQGAIVGNRYIMLGIGRGLTRVGILKDPEGTIFLTLDELRGVLHELAIDESAATLTYKDLLPPMVRKRRAIWEELRKVTPPPSIGKIPEKAVLDPLMIKIWGFTPEVLAGKISMEPTKRLEGFAGAPGIVEGIARVCTDVDTAFTEVMPEDILVAPGTNTSWTALFSKIKAVVTDGGGMLAHAAITARDYGIPAVVGTWKATKMIQTGQRIRVNGTDGVVELLD